MTDSSDPISDHDPTGPGFTLSRNTVLLVSGGLVFLAVALSLLQQRLAAKRDAPNPDDLIVSGDWEESLRHFAGAWEYRFAGTEERLDRNEAALRDLAGEPQPNYATPIGSPAVVAASPVPDAPLPNGTHPDVGAIEPPPPRIASTSL